MGWTFSVQDTLLDENNAGSGSRIVVGVRPGGDVPYGKLPAQEVNDPSSCPTPAQAYKVINVRVH